MITHESDRSGIIVEKIPKGIISQTVVWFHRTSQINNTEEYQSYVPEMEDA